MHMDSNQLCKGGGGRCMFWYLMPGDGAGENGGEERAKGQLPELGGRAIVGGLQGWGQT